MAFADWLLSRSEAFKLLMMKFRDHKQDTVQAFSKVKSKHNNFDKRFDEHSTRLDQMEDVIKLMHEKISVETRPTIIIKKRTRRR